MTPPFDTKPFESTQDQDEDTGLSSLHPLGGLNDEEVAAFAVNEESAGVTDAEVTADAVVAPSGEETPEIASETVAPGAVVHEDLKLKPKISVIGVGGAGGNAVNNMIRSKLEGVEFIVSNTDAQALTQSLTDERIQLGLKITQGLGAGSRPEVGKASAEEAMAEVLSHIEDSNMVFITAGMGGGTGTGAAPVIAQAAREKGILTVGVITKPFHFEGAHRMRTAEKGIEELQKHVDTLIIIPNQNLFRVANEKTTFADAFKMADDVLHAGVRSVTDLMIMPGLINLDFADIRAVMGEMGKAMMGTGEAEGERRAIDAAEAAISNPLLDDVSMRGARGVLISVTGGMDMTLFEVDEAANRIRDEVDVDANIIFGSTFDERLNGRIRVSVVATGIDQEEVSKLDDSVKKMGLSPEAIEAVSGTSENANEESFEQSLDKYNNLTFEDEIDLTDSNSFSSDGASADTMMLNPEGQDSGFGVMNNANISGFPQGTFSDSSASPETGAAAGWGEAPHMMSAAEASAHYNKPQKEGFFRRLTNSLRGGKSKKNKMQPYAENYGGQPNVPGAQGQLGVSHSPEGGAHQKLAAQENVTSFPQKGMQPHTQAPLPGFEEKKGPLAEMPSDDEPACVRRGRR